MTDVDRRITSQIKKMVGVTDLDQAVVFDFESRLEKEFLFEIERDESLYIGTGEI